MSVGFGFSIGDFIAVLKLVGDVIDSLKDSGDSSREYRRLLLQLLDLEAALIHIRRLELSDAQTDQGNALKHAALRCRSTVDEFMNKIQKYQPHLTTDGILPGSGIKRSWYKVKWALCRKEDVEKFRADLVGHTEALNVLMNAIQIQQMTLQTRDRTEQHLSLKALIQSQFSAAMQKLASVSDLVKSSISTTKELLAITTSTAQIDCKIFAVVLDMQDLLRRTLAPQILRNQPVYFVDALGIKSPFYLEFIRSKEAFLAVLRHNLQGHQPAVERVDNGDFAISDVVTKRDIDISLPWQLLFRPGQRVDMSMILNEQDTSVSTCPSCKVESTGDNDKDVTCTNCGLTYRRVAPILSEEGVEISSDEYCGSNGQHNKTPVSFGPEQVSQKRKRVDMDDELMLYRKVRLRTQFLLLADEASKRLRIEMSKGSGFAEKGSDESLMPVLSDGLEYVDRVKAQYIDQPDIYNKFLSVLTDYRRRNTSVKETYLKIVKLFGPSELLDDFGKFLPKGFRDTIVESLDEGSCVQIPIPTPAFIQQSAIQSFEFLGPSRGLNQFHKILPQEFDNQLASFLDFEQHDQDTIEMLSRTQNPLVRQIVSGPMPDTGADVVSTEHVS